MLGADDYVTKPFSPSELVARVDSLYQAGWRLRKCGRKIISRRSWFPAILY